MKRFTISLYYFSSFLRMMLYRFERFFLKCRINCIDISTFVEYNCSTNVEKGENIVKDIKRLPESELEIMQIIWKEQTPVSRAVIEHALNDIHPLAPTTILTLLTRLCEKGFLSLKKEGRSNLYEPLITEKEYLASESRSFLDRLFNGSVAGFAAALCDSGVKKEEVEELKRLLEKGEL